MAGGAESPEVDGWSAAGDTYAQVVRLAEEGIPLALGHDAALEHYVSWVRIPPPPFIGRIRFGRAVCGVSITRTRSKPRK
jgi:hypothetical protein